MQDNLIFVVEDDAGIRELVLYTLRSQGFKCEGFESPAEFWKRLEEVKPVLLILDLMYHFCPVMLNSVRRITYYYTAVIKLFCDLNCIPHYWAAVSVNIYFHFLISSHLQYHQKKSPYPP